MNSREQILQMVKDGILSVDEGLRLLEAVDETPAAVPAARTSRMRLLRVVVDSARGDRVRVNIPISLLKAGLDFSKQLKISGLEMNTDQLDIDLIMQAIQAGQVGEIVDVVTESGDRVQVFVD